MYKTDNHIIHHSYKNDTTRMYIHVKNLSYFIVFATGYKLLGACILRIKNILYKV